MEPMDRRKFLKAVGVGSGAIAAGTMVPSFLLRGGSGGNILTFRGVAGLPTGPIPAYATLVVEGRANPETRSGVVTRTVYAGHPEEMSQVGLPGMSQIARVTDVRDVGGVVEIVAAIDDRSQVRRGETDIVTIRIDRSAGVARAPFMGREIALRLVS